MDYAETGDILLFRSKKFSSKLQRTFTRSNYDHIALLLKYTNGKVVIFEATGKEGIVLCTWESFIKNNWHKIYSKYVFFVIFSCLLE